VSINQKPQSASLLHYRLALQQIVARLGERVKHFPLPATAGSPFPIQGDGKGCCFTVHYYHVYQSLSRFSPHRPSTRPNDLKFPVFSKRFENYPNHRAANAWTRTGKLFYAEFIGKMANRLPDPGRFSPTARTNHSDAIFKFFVCRYQYSEAGNSLTGPPFKNLSLVVLTLIS